MLIGYFLLCLNVSIVIMRNKYLVAFCDMIKRECVHLYECVLNQ